MKSFEEIKKNENLEILKTGIDGGMGILHITGLRKCTLIWSFAGGWEHVSICPANRLPEWEEMCLVKDTFWNEDECVVQYHPPKSEYVNLTSNCLHLWKPTKEMLPVPPIAFV